MIASTWSRLADWVGDACGHLILSALWIGALVAITVIAPIYAIVRLHRRDPFRTEAVLRAGTRVVWAPIAGAADVMDRGAAWSSRLRSRLSVMAADGRNQAWMAVLCPLATIGLVIATRAGWRTEQGTLDVALNPGFLGSQLGGTVAALLRPVRDWMTIGIFFLGFVGGTLVMEGLGRTHFLERAVRSDDAPAPGSFTTDADQRDAVEAERGRFARAVSATPWGRIGLVGIGLLVLAIPVYALTTAATSRANATVLSEQQDLANRGWNCDPRTGVNVEEAATPGVPTLSPRLGASTCQRLVDKRLQALRWGVVTALGMALLDVLLGWMVLLSVVWLLAAATGVLEGFSRLVAGAARAVSNVVHRLLVLVLAVVQGEDDDSGTAPGSGSVVGDSSPGAPGIGLPGNRTSPPPPPYQPGTPPPWGVPPSPVDDVPPGFDPWADDDGTPVRPAA